MWRRPTLDILFRPFGIPVFNNMCIWLSIFWLWAYLMKVIPVMYTKLYIYFILDIIIKWLIFHSALLLLFFSFSITRTMQNLRYIQFMRPVQTFSDKIKWKTNMLHCRNSFKIESKNCRKTENLYIT
jgi:hypothetical protein